MKRLTAAVAAMVILAIALVAGHQWSEARGEDHAPVWSCHTMGNRVCGPDSPWHGITTR